MIRSPEHVKGSLNRTIEDIDIPKRSLNFSGFNLSCKDFSPGPVSLLSSIAAHLSYKDFSPGFLSLSLHKLQCINFILTQQGVVPRYRHYWPTIRTASVTLLMMLISLNGFYTRVASSAINISPPQQDLVQRY